MENKKIAIATFVSNNFRYKNPLFKSGSSFLFLYKTHRGKSIQSCRANPYFNLFLSGKIFRETCYQCPYAKLNRAGDITIGDCDSHPLYPNFYPSESNSTLMLNTAKAIGVWNDGLKGLFEYEKMDVEKEAERNKQLSRPFQRPAEHDGIYTKLYSMFLAELVGTYGFYESVLQKVKLRFLLFMPQSIIKSWANIKQTLSKWLLNRQ